MSEVNWMRWNAAADGAGQRGGQRGLAHAGHVLDQQVAAREEADDGEPDHLGLADQGAADVVLETANDLRRAAHRIPLYRTRHFSTARAPLARAGRHRLQCGRDDPRDPALPALAPRRARRVRVHLRSRRGDAVDGARRPRAGDALAGPLRSGGGAAAHPRRCCGRNEIRASFFIPAWVAEHHPDAVRGHRGRRPRDRLPRRRAREGQRSAGRARGGDPGQEPRGADPLGGKRPLGYRAPAWQLSAETLGLLGRHGFDYSSNMMDRLSPYLHPRGGRPRAGGDPGLVGARRRALLHVHRAAGDAAAGPGAAGLAHRVRGDHRGARGDQLHLPPADHRATVAAGLPARADRPRAPHPAGVDRLARGDQRPLPRDRGGPLG